MQSQQKPLRSHGTFSHRSPWGFQILLKSRKKTFSGIETVPPGTSSTLPSSPPDDDLDQLSRAPAFVDDFSSDPKGTLGLTLLHAPPEDEPVLCDMVFVHGLGGGSRKTWSKTGTESHFWPAKWLPEDPDFKNVRIHTFGYDSDWTKGNNNCLNLHHMGLSLVGQLSTSPEISRSNTSLVFIGHSMGGLVIKKAFVLACHQNKKLAERVRAIYFIATPHRGADLAKTLKNILQLVFSAPSYVVELIPGSDVLQAINDDFRQHAEGLELCSFYETRQFRAGIGISALVVDPESARLGYPREKQYPMNADHRSICKFDSPKDENYRIVRNALASTVQNIRDTVNTAETQASPRQDQMETLAEYLGVVDEVMNDLADDLADIRELRLPGTCEWILEKEYYLNWKDSEPSDFPPVLWMAGKPATGKSVLSGFIVDDLEVSDAAYSYYFFKHGDRSKSALSTCLRSLAFQMASLDPGIRDLFLKLHSSRVKVDYGNERSLWRTFFAPKVFKEATVQHFWVIDALDECSNFAPLLESMLSKMENDGRLRILITSRETPELCRLFSTLGPGKHFTAHISPEETLSDIKRLVEHKRSALCTLDEETRQILEKRIIEKSKGSFLWTVLVLEELSKSYIRRDVETVLEEVPRGMGQLYYRALEAMAVATRGKELAKALLTWTACVIRPLTLAELQAALEIDLRDKIANMKETIRTLCGQLLVIDKQERVQMVHETAREFLLDTQLGSEFAVDETQAHTRIARVCLEYLVGDEMKPPRIVARGSASSRAAKKSDFFLYASTMFSTHLAKANPTSDEIVTLVEKFLELNILTWIEKIAERRELGLMINVAKDLRTYADCYMAARSPSRRDLQALKSWSQDLQRIAAKFADILISCPSAIYNRIQAFCPQDSAIHSLSPPGKKLSVLGLPVLPWDDRLSCLGFEKETTALRYGEEFLVVGMREGRIAVYHANCYHEYRNLNHGETVRHLDLQEKYGFLASAGGKTIQIWNIRTGQVLHRLRAPRQCIGLFFVDNILTAVSNQNELVSWNVRNEEVLEYTRDPWLKWANDEFLSLHRPPSAVSVAVAQKMMAVAYASHPVTIWDLEGNTYVGECGKKLVTGETSTHPVVALLFNPNSDIGLLAISYLDGDLAIVDPFADIELERQRPSCHTLAASPDGHLLAGGGGGGIIQIWKFDTLTLLYKVKSSDIFIKVLAFSHDGSTLADLRGSQCNIWTPPILLSSSYLKDDLSVDTVDTEEIAKELTDLTPKPKITSLVIIPNKKGIICGLEDGSVRLYENNTGNLVAKLYSHVSAAVNTLSWLPRSQRVISTCVANRIMAQAVEMQVYPSCGIRSVTTSPIVNIRLNIGSTIIHLLPDPTENRFLLSSHRSDHLWNLSSREEEQSLNHGSYTTRRWLQHPRSESHLICVEPEFVHLHRWEDLSRVSSVSLANNSLLGLSIKGVFPYPRRDIVLLDLTDANGSSGTRDMSVLHCNDIPLVLDDEEAGCERNPLSNKPQTNVPSAHQDLSRKALGKQPEQSLGQLLSISRLGSLGIRVAHVVGILASPRGSRMVFLNARSWVCSVLIDTIIQPNANVTSYTQHFFVPHDWFAGTRKPIGGIMENGDLVFTKAGDVAIIKGWLDFGEVVELESAQKGNGQEAREKGRPALRREGSSKLGAPSRERSSLR